VVAAIERGLGYRLRSGRPGKCGFCNCSVSSIDDGSELAAWFHNELIRRAQRVTRRLTLHATLQDAAWFEAYPLIAAVGTSPGYDAFYDYRRSMRGDAPIAAEYAAYTLYSGILGALTAGPADVHIDRWLHDDYPGLRPQQE